MSAAKSERILNLLIALLTTKRFLSKAEIREMVDGYARTASFERTFERDKAELRALGIPLRTGSNDPDSTDEDGYRIDRLEFELPDVEFTRDELVAIGLAAHAWQTSVGAEATSTALQRLRAAGAAPDLDRLPNVRAHIPATEPSFDVIYEAQLARRCVEFEYGGRTRRVQPWQLSQRRGLWLVLGFDVDRQAPRRFKLSRIDGVARAVGPDDAFQVPDDLTEYLAPTSAQASAVIAVRDAPELLADSSPATWTDPLPEGFVAREVRGFNDDMIITEVCAAGPDAFVLAPDHLREAVVERLKALAGGNHE